MSDAPPPWDGVPRDPERDGWHWISDANSDPVAVHWRADIDRWGDWPFTPAAAMADENTYLGPCHTPAEATAIRDAAWAAGWAAGREAAAVSQECGCALREQIATSPPNSAARWNICGQANCAAIIAAEIRALPVPAPPSQVGGLHE